MNLTKVTTIINDDLENSDVGNMRQELDILNNRLNVIPNITFKTYTKSQAINANTPTTISLTNQTLSGYTESFTFCKGLTANTNWTMIDMFVPFNSGKVVMVRSMVAQTITLIFVTCYIKN